MHPKRMHQHYLLTTAHPLSMRMVPPLHQTLCSPCHRERGIDPKLSKTNHQSCLAIAATRFRHVASSSNVAHSLQLWTSSKFWHLVLGSTCPQLYAALQLLNICHQTSISTPCQLCAAPLALTVSLFTLSCTCSQSCQALNHTQS